jgi:hypothetical protein
LVDLYRSSGIGRIEFCNSHGMSLSTLDRNLKKQRKQQNRGISKHVRPGRLVAVELGRPVSAVAAGELSALTVLVTGGRRVEVRRGFDADTLAQLVTVLERL